MALKSIYDIEVNSDAFTAFQAMFQRHQDAVAKMPGAWGNVGKAAEGATASFDDLVRAAQITAAATASIALQQDKVSVATKGTDRAAESLVRHTAGIAHNIKDATVSLLKWSGILGAVSGLLGAGGIWGIDRLAASAAGSRRAASGLGVTSGEDQAFSINYARTLDNPHSFLENIANAKSNYKDRWAFGAMGINDYNQKNAADLAPEMVRRAKKMYDSSDGSQQYADASGLTTFFTMDDLRRLHSMTEAEIDAANGRYQQDKKTLAVQADTQRAWTDFQSQMQRASTQIENTFITGLVPLAAPLEHLSASFTDLVAALLKSPQIKEWMGELGNGLETFAKYIGTPAFKADVEGFAAGIGRLVKAIEGGVTWLLGLIPGAKPNGPPNRFGLYGPQMPTVPQLPTTAPEVKKDFQNKNGLMERALKNGVSPWDEMQRERTDPWFQSHSAARFRGSIFSPDQDARAETAWGYLTSEGHTQEEAAAIMGNLAVEDPTLDPSVVNMAGGGKGAQGIAGWRGDRIDQFKNIYGTEPKDASFDKQLQFLEWELQHTEKSSGDALRKASGVDEKTSVFRKAFERPSEGEYFGSEAPAIRRAQHYLHTYANDTRVQPPVKVEVKNSTGGSAVVTANNAAVQ